MKWTEKEYNEIDIVFECEFDLDPALMSGDEIASFVIDWAYYFPSEIVKKAQSSVQNAKNEVLKIDG